DVVVANNINDQGAIRKSVGRRFNSAPPHPVSSNKTAEIACAFPLFAANLAPATSSIHLAISTPDRSQLCFKIARETDCVAEGRVGHPLPQTGSHCRKVIEITRKPGGNGYVLVPRLGHQFAQANLIQQTDSSA